MSDAGVSRWLAILVPVWVFHALIAAGLTVGALTATVHSVGALWVDTETSQSSSFHYDYDAAQSVDTSLRASSATDAAGNSPRLTPPDRGGYRYDDRSNFLEASAGVDSYRSAPNTTRAAAGVADNALPAALRGGPANVHVYQGVSGGKPVYTGITNDLARRGAQHGSRFELLEAVTTSPVTRGQARAIEEALFVRNPGFQTIRHPISPSHAWYQDALDWGNTWLRNSGF